MSTYYLKQDISTCEIAGAITLAALHDLRVNLFTFGGFPQVSVFEASTDKFKIVLSWVSNEGITNSVDFELSEKAAFSAAKRFRKKNTHEQAIFEPIQKALAELEERLARPLQKTAPCRRNLRPS
jgi:hypothetical protein